MVATITIILIVISIFHTAILPNFAVYGSTPDIFLLFIIFLSLNSQTRQITIANWVSGLSKDVFSDGTFGVSAFLFIIIGFVINRYKDVVFKGHPLTQFLITLSASLFYNLSYAGFMFITSSKTELYIVAQKVIFSSLYTSVIVSVVFFIFKKSAYRLGLKKINSFEKRN